MKEQNEAVVDVSEEEERERLIHERNRRASERDAAKRRAQLEGLRLEAKYEKECGPVGVEFQIIDATELNEGFVVVRRAEEVLWKRYMASKQDADAAHELVLPCVIHPAKEKYLEIRTRRGFLDERCATAIGAMQGVRVRLEEGKF